MTPASLLLVLALLALGSGVLCLAALVIAVAHVYEPKKNQAKRRAKCRHDDLHLQ